MQWEVFAASEDLSDRLLTHQIYTKIWEETEEVPGNTLLIYTSEGLNGNLVKMIGEPCNGTPLIKSIPDVPEYANGHPFVIAVVLQALQEKERRVTKALKRALNQYMAWPENGRPAPWTRETCQVLHLWRITAEETLWRDALVKNASIRKGLIH